MLSDFLLINQTMNFENISNTIFDLFKLYVPLLVIIAGIFEMLGRNSWDNFLTKCFFAIFLSFQIVPFVKLTVPYAMDFGSKIIDLNQTEHILLSVVSKKSNPGTQDSDNDGLMSLIGSGIANFTNDFIVSSLIFLSYFLVSLIGVFYSFVYSLLIVLGPSMCLISIFPLTEKALTYAWSSAIWLILTPVVLGCVLAICEVSGMNSLLKEGELDSIANYSYFFIYTCLIFFCPAIASGLISHKGLNSFSDKMQTIAGAGIVLSTLSKGASIGGAVGGHMVLQSAESGFKGLAEGGIKGGALGFLQGLKSTPIGSRVASASVVSLGAGIGASKSILNLGREIASTPERLSNFGINDSKINSIESFNGGFKSVHDSSRQMSSSNRTSHSAGSESLKPERPRSNSAEYLNDKRPGLSEKNLNQFESYNSSMSNHVLNNKPQGFKDFNQNINNKMLRSSSFKKLSKGSRKWT